MYSTSWNSVSFLLSSIIWRRRSPQPSACLTHSIPWMNFCETLRPTAFVQKSPFATVFSTFAHWKCCHLSNNTHCVIFCVSCSFRTRPIDWLVDKLIVISKCWTFFKFLESVVWNALTILLITFFYKLNCVCFYTVNLQFILLLHSRNV